MSLRTRAAAPALSAICTCHRAVVAAQLNSLRGHKHCPPFGFSAENMTIQNEFQTLVTILFWKEVSKYQKFLGYQLWWQMSQHGSWWDFWQPSVWVWFVVVVGLWGVYRFCLLFCFCSSPHPVYKPCQRELPQKYMEPEFQEGQTGKLMYLLTAWQVKNLMTPQKNIRDQSVFIKQTNNIRQAPFCSH